MPGQVALVYNEPEASRYDATGEVKAVLGVLEAVEAVHKSLLELGYAVTRLPLALPEEQAARKLKELNVDLVFNLFEGFAGFPETEALIPETLSRLGIPFTGCQARVIRLALDKSAVKVILKSGGIPTPDFQVLTPDTVNSFCLKYPCIVKPCGEDASHGLTEKSVVNSFIALARQVRLISKSYGGRALVERFIGGREFNATIMGKHSFEVLPISEIVYSLPAGLPRILTFAAKWMDDTPYFDGTSAVCPAGVTEEQGRRVADTALAAFRLLGCRGYGRVDMREDEEGRVNVIEVNPNPDISPGTGAARQAAADGLTYSRFVEKIIDIALEKEPDDNAYPPDARQRQASPDADFEGDSRVQAR